jgi:outer membrane protein OmpA-like peptidoglycan-associated protein
MYLYQNINKSLLTFFLLFAHFSLLAQFGEGLAIQKVKSVYIREADSVENVAGEAVPFPKLMAGRYFQDRKLLEKIEKAKDSTRLHQPLLSKYVAQFCIENFSKDNLMLWQLARDFQILKDTSRAIMMYELAAKHKTGARTPPATVDSLNLFTKSDWLPLEEYYSLLELRKRVDTLMPPKKVLQNMGKLINSEAADYGPFMHPSDSVLVFTSRRGANKEIDYIFTREDENIYYSIRDFRNGKWEPATQLPDSINTTKFNEGSACVSPDGKHLYFTRCFEPNAMGDCDIYHSEYKDGHWTAIKPLGGKVNSAQWDSQPNISNDGNMLFFASNRKGGFGGTDIFYCLRQSDGTWGAAQNVGPVINTPENEVTPFYHQLNKTLYFGSTGQLRSYGAYDIYKSNWTGLQWEEPKNLGPLINTAANEYYFSINGKGETIYYAKSFDTDNKSLEEDKQNFDIYSFTMPMEARPDALTKLSGYLVDSTTQKPLLGRVVLVDLDNGIEIAPKKINENGYFEFMVKNNNHYRIYVVGDNYLTIRNDVSLKRRDTTFQVFTESFQENRPLIFESLEFAENSTELAYAAKPKLDYLARFLKNYPMFMVCIKGHTDSDGSEDYNEKLSQRRANQIKNYLEDVDSIDKTRIVAEGYGESRPLVPNDNAENKRKNRRVEFELRMDPRYQGDVILPTKEETTFNGEYMYEEIQESESEDNDMSDFFKEFDLEDWQDDDTGDGINDDTDLENLLNGEDDTPDIMDDDYSTKKKEGQ